MENFSFYGYVKDCTTGKPLPGIPIAIAATTAGTPDIFGNPGTAYNVGSAITDNNGYFKITPIKQNGIVNYDLILNDSLANITFTRSITADSIHKSSLTEFDLSFNTNSYGYLKIFYSDSSLADTSDMVSIDVDCPGNKCGPGFNVIVGEASPRPWPENLGIFKGNIQNGYAVYRVLGNATNSIFYTKGSKFFTDALHSVTVYCKANETTYYKFNY